jgi:cyclohexa-1,5-dienecarbonyl-CoA hydratase
MSAPGTGIRAAFEGPVARITLDRPPLNVLTIDALAALASALRAAAARADVRVVRLDAAGKAFCAGVDVGDHIGAKLPLMMDALADLFAAFDEVPQPVVALVHGAALGGGCEVVLGADVVLASERALFGQPEIKLGVFAPPASVLLPRIVGERRALGLLLTGDTISAAEAERIGLVNRTFPDDRFDGESAAWIDRLAGLSGTALRFAKRAVAAARDLPAPRAHAALDRIYRDELLQTADANEGLDAFLAKRAPVWKHR